MAILISAPIRTGKTLFAIKCIFEELNKGRQVFTNIIGIKIDGVISVSSTIDHPFDWRDLPNGSVLVWDEAHEHPAFAEQDLLKELKIPEFEDLIMKTELSDLPASEKKERLNLLERKYKQSLLRKKEAIRDIGRGLLMHGQYGIEIYFITQRVNKLNTDALASVTSHFVMRRKFGMDAAIIWEFGEAMTTWSKSTADIALNKKVWRYPKYLYKFYVSSENHQVRKSFPLKYAAFALVPIALFGFGYTRAQETGFFGVFGKKEEKQVVTNSAPNPNPTPVQSSQSDKNQFPVPALVTQEKLPEDFTPEQHCRMGQYVETQTCKNWYAKMSETNFNQPNKPDLVAYDPNSPYDFKPPATTIQVRDYPRLTGCARNLEGKYVGIDQQGNIMPNISQADCKRWMSGERLFDYSQAPTQRTSMESLSTGETNVSNAS